MVVGASTGIGRATAVAAAVAGAGVVGLARRPELVDALTSEVGGHVAGVACDVRSRQACDDAVATALERLGGLDTVVYSAGVNHLALLPATGEEDWRRLFETNVVGAASIVAAALPALRAVGGRVALLSSDSVADPWPGLGAYVATKAALEALTAAWRAEEPAVSFTRAVVGPTLTGMAEAWDPELAAAMFERWHAEGRFDGIEPQPPEVVAAALVEWAALAEVPTDLDLHLLARRPEA